MNRPPVVAVLLRFGRRKQRGAGLRTAPSEAAENTGYARLIGFDPEPRAVRLAKNETFFREANELTEQETSGRGRQQFFCECSSRGCVNRVPLTKPEYEHVRAASDQFLVVPGHENAEVERIVERFPGYLIVAKIGVAGEYADLTDPRE